LAHISSLNGSDTCNKMCYTLGEVKFGLSSKAKTKVLNQSSFLI